MSFGCTGHDRGFKNESIRDIKYTEITVDTLDIRLPNTSFGGHSGVQGDRIYFLDKYFGHLYLMDVNGKVNDRKMGLGRAANEIPIKSSLAAAVKNDDLLVFGGTYDAYVFKNFGKRKKIDILVSPQKKSLEDSRAYTSFSEIVRINNRDEFFYNIYSEAEFANPAEHDKKYFRDAHILMKVDLKTGHARPVGKYSSYYVENYANIKHLFGIVYDIDKEDNFYVSYQTDSLIYMYDENFRILRAFGFEGKNMDKAYGRARYGWENFNKTYKEDIETKGYYYWLEHIDATGHSFRSYRKGQNSGYDGLQIYRDGILVGDVEVPKQFKVCGYIPPYYVTQIICDEEKESLKLYRFKLEER